MQNSNNVKTFLTRCCKGWTIDHVQSFGILKTACYKRPRPSNYALVNGGVIYFGGDVASLDKLPGGYQVLRRKHRHPAWTVPDAHVRKRLDYCFY